MPRHTQPPTQPTACTPSTPHQAAESTLTLSWLRQATPHARALASMALGWLALRSSTSWAHDGHGLGGSHWHASDTVGLLLGAAAVAAVWWFKGKP